MMTELELLYPTEIQLHN